MESTNITNNIDKHIARVYNGMFVSFLLILIGYLSYPFIDTIIKIPLKDIPIVLVAVIAIFSIFYFVGLLTEKACKPPKQ